MSVLVIGGLLPACSQPELRADFDSDHPQERTLALAHAVRDDDRSAISNLILLLDSPDQVDRMLAIRALERWTGNTFGYHHSGPEIDRRAAADRWLAWAQDEGLLVDE